MSDHIPGDGRTFAHHLITGNFNQIFHHDIPIVLGVEKHAADALKAEWLKLEPELQNGLLYASKVTNEIKDGIDKAPEEVVAAIEKFVPADVIDKVKEVTTQASAELTGIAAIPDQDFITTVKNLQAYFKSKSGSFGRWFSQAAQTIANIFSPDSPYAKIVQYIEIAYQLIKAA